VARPRSTTGEHNGNDSYHERRGEAPHAGRKHSVIQAVLNTPGVGLANAVTAAPPLCIAVGLQLSDVDLKDARQNQAPGHQCTDYSPDDSRGPPRPPRQRFRLAPADCVHAPSLHSRGSALRETAEGSPAMRYYESCTG